MFIEKEKVGGGSWEKKKNTKQAKAPVQGIEKLDDDEHREGHGHGTVIMEEMTTSFGIGGVVAKVSGGVVLCGALHKVGLFVMGAVSKFLHIHI